MSSTSGSWNELGESPVLGTWADLVETSPLEVFESMLNNGTKKKL